MRIIFMGTPAFAVASLSALLQAGEEIVAVVTAPDRPAGRGRKLTASAVKTFAVAQNLPVLQPENLKDPAFLEALRSYQAELQIVVAFRMLPEVVWNMPPRGTFNLHASLLPQYRGAAPINHAIINGESETGVTTFMLQHAIDTGDVLFAEKTRIEPDENAGQLHDRLMEMGAKLVVHTVRAIREGKAIPRPQHQHQDSKTDTPLRPAPKIFRADTAIDWRLPTETIYNKIRGLSPYPAAFTELHGKSTKVLAAEKINEHGNSRLQTPGTVVSDGKSYLHIATSDGYIALTEVQPEGKRPMPIEDYLRGLRS